MQGTVISCHAVVVLSSCPISKYHSVMQRDGASSEKSAAASALKKRVEESRDARGLRGRRRGERERKRGNDKDSGSVQVFY